MPKGEWEVISIEADAAVPDTYGLDRFMEEVNILELEGYYFCPNKNEVGNTDKRTITPGDLAGKPVTIAFSNYGRPGELAYKLLQAAFFKLTQEQHDASGWVSFSWRELLGLMGLSVGGRQTKEAYRVIKQLENTEISCSVSYKEKNRSSVWEKKWRSKSFKIVMTVSFEGDERGRFARTAFQLHELVIRNFQDRHVSYFNWERMRGLSMVGMMLYKRLFRHMANVYRDGMARDHLIFDKDYEPICTTWLGLKPHTQKSRIVEQLRSLDDLMAHRLLRAWKVTKGKKGQWKVVAYPGTGFFADYEHIYKRKPATVEPLPAQPEPLAYLTDFHRQLGNEQEEFAPKEVAYVRELLKRYNDEELRDFMSFGIAQARATHFPVQWFGALALYEGKWQAQRQKKLRSSARQSAVASCSFCNEQGVFEFDDGSVAVCPHSAVRLAHIHRQKPIRSFHEA
jgi:hypothetical protein